MASETTILNLTEKQLSELQSNGYVMVSRPNGSFKIKLSDFQAASGAATQSYVTSAIQSEAQRANAYTDSAVGALDIPTKTSDLTNDSGFIDDAEAYGKQYCRKNNNWVEVESGSGGSDWEDFSNNVTNTGSNTISLSNSIFEINRKRKLLRVHLCISSGAFNIYFSSQLVFNGITFVGNQICAGVLSTKNSYVTIDSSPSFVTMYVSNSTTLQLKSNGNGSYVDIIGMFKIS